MLRSTVVLFLISWLGVSAAVAQTATPETVSAGSFTLRGGFDTNPTDTLGARGSSFVTQAGEYEYLRGSLDGEGYGLKLRAADFAAEAIDFVIRDRAKLALHFFGNLDAKFAFQKIGDTAFAGLAIDANNFPVFAADVSWVNRAHVPPGCKWGLSRLLSRPGRECHTRFRRPRCRLHAAAPIARKSVEIE